MTRWILCALGLAILVAGCHRPRQYAAMAEVKRYSVVRKEPDGTTSVGELELEYAQCPGSQIDVIRGNSAFAKCLEERVKVGTTVPIGVVRRWTDDGHWDHDIVDVGGCTHTLDPNDEGTFKIVRECRDLRVNQTAVGFTCDTLVDEKVVAACPWFER